MTNENFFKLVSTINNSEFTQEEINTLKDTVESSQSSMTEEQYKMILSAIDKASESVRPFIIASNDEMTVVGDANDTKPKPYDYKIVFRRPVFDKDGNITSEAEEEKEYKNIYITPRKQTKVEKMLVMIMPYFKKEDGSEYTMMELADIFASMDETLYDYMYDLVSAILEIPEEDKEYMTPGSVIATVIRFMFGNPEAVNEANAFFGSLPDNPEGIKNEQNLSSLI